SSEDTCIYCMCLIAVQSPKTTCDAFLGSGLGVAMGSPCGSPYCRVSALRGADLPTPQPTRFNAHPSVRGPYASASRLRLALLGGTGIFNPFPIAYAFRPRLRSRLTLFRLTLNRNP